jgi:hypothetical protein
MPGIGRARLDNPSRPVHPIGTKACRFHHGAVGRALRRRDRYVEVFVLTGLMAEKCIDPPTTIEPDVDAVLFQQAY